MPTGIRNPRTDWVALEDPTVEACVPGAVWADTVRRPGSSVAVDNSEADTADDCSEVLAAGGWEGSPGVGLPEEPAGPRSSECSVDVTAGVRSRREAEGLPGVPAESPGAVETWVGPDWGTAVTVGGFATESTVGGTDEAKDAGTDEEVPAGVVDAENRAGVAAGAEDAVASADLVDAEEEDPECVSGDAACAVAVEAVVGPVAVVAEEGVPEDANVADDEEHHEEDPVDVAEIAVAAAVGGEEEVRVDAADVGALAGVADVAGEVVVQADVAGAADEVAAQAGVAGVVGVQADAAGVEEEVQVDVADGGEEVRADAGGDLGGPRGEVVGAAHAPGSRVHPAAGSCPVARRVEYYRLVDIAGWRVMVLVEVDLLASTCSFGWVRTEMGHCLARDWIGCCNFAEVVQLERAMDWVDRWVVETVENWMLEPEDTVVAEHFQDNPDPLVAVGTSWFEDRD